MSTNTETRQRLFKLEPGGTSDRAAKIVFEQVAAARMREVWPSGASADARQRAEIAWENRQHAALSMIAPEALKNLGFDKPAVEVYNYEAGLPRSYHQYPELSVHTVDMRGTQRHTFFLTVPEGYDRTVFVPGDSQEYIGAAKAHVLQSVGDTLLPVLSRATKGIETPRDFDPARHYAILVPRTQRQLGSVFVADGRSQAEADRYQADTLTYKLALRRIVDKLDDIVTRDLRADFASQLAAGEAYYMNSSTTTDLASGNRPVFRISAATAGNAESARLGRRLLTIPPNPHFETTGTPAELTVHPKVATASGRVLEAMMAVVPPAPAVEDYHVLRLGSPRQWVFPRIETLGGQTLLSYDIAANKISRPPPDATPLSSAATLWLREDEADKAIGRIPPPPPDTLAEPLRKTFGIGAVFPRAKPSTSCHHSP